MPPKSKRKFTPCLKLEKLKDSQTSSHFQEVFILHVSAGVADTATEDIWNNIKTAACSRQLRRCVAQLDPIVGVVKPGGEMSMWKRPLLPAESFPGIEEW